MFMFSRFFDRTKHFCFANVQYISFLIIICFLLASCLVMLNTILELSFLILIDYEADYSDLKTILTCPRNEQ